MIPKTKEEENLERIRRMNIVRQQLVISDQFYDEEIANEFYLLAPVDINDMYNQN